MRISSVVVVFLGALASSLQVVSAITRKCQGKALMCMTPPKKKASKAPTKKPVKKPTRKPIPKIVKPPTARPTARPTKQPSMTPTKRPTAALSLSPTAAPTSAPTEGPTSGPTLLPTGGPTSKPSSKPSRFPTVKPTNTPTNTPTASPTALPTVAPTSAPTAPTSAPTEGPTSGPTLIPTGGPTSKPSSKPSPFPTSAPTEGPTAGPTLIPTGGPTSKPSSKPSPFPTSAPTEGPTSGPTLIPTGSPTSKPSSKPSRFPTFKPTTAPTETPTSIPTSKPTYATVTCPGVGNTLSYGGNLYKAVTGTYTWNAANAAAQSYSCCGSVGNLASILSSAENDFIRLNLGGVNGWIGFNDKAVEGSFVWTSGEATSYTNWNSGEPNNAGNEDCAEIFGTGGKWNDLPCTGYTRSAYIIKFDCNNPKTRTPTAPPTAAPTKRPTHTPTSKPTYTTVSCPGVGNTLSYGGNLYKAVTGSYTWAAAHVAAQSYSCCGSIGNLASIMNSAENDFIRLNLGGVEGWIGYNDKAAEGSFVWTSGEAVTYTNWNSGEPNDFGSNEDCAEIYGVGGKWNDLPCTGRSLSAFIIKFDCNNPKTRTPTALPTTSPTKKPTSAPTSKPTSVPTASPTVPPTAPPTAEPTQAPTAAPTHIPTAVPTTKQPTHIPTVPPTDSPTSHPTSSPTYQSVMCPGVGNTLLYNDHLYKAVTSGVYTWEHANGNATTYSCCGAVGHLASITDTAENDFIRLRLGGVDGWIGINDKAAEGTPSWTTGEAVTYTNWNSAEPNDAGGNEDCGEIYGSGGKWNDLPCSGYFLGAYIIEFDCT